LHQLVKVHKLTFQVKVLHQLKCKLRFQVKVLHQLGTHKWEISLVGAL
jgi:hypothetical protein